MLQQQAPSPSSSSQHHHQHRPPFPQQSCSTPPLPFLACMQAETHALSAARMSLMAVCSTAPGLPPRVKLLRWYTGSLKRCTRATDWGAEERTTSDRESSTDWLRPCNSYRRPRKWQTGSMDVMVTAWSDATTGQNTRSCCRERMHAALTSETYTLQHIRPLLPLEAMA